MTSCFYGAQYCCPLCLINIFWLFTTAWMTQVNFLYKKLITMKTNWFPSATKELTFVMLEKWYLISVFKCCINICGAHPLYLLYKLKILEHMWLSLVMTCCFSKKQNPTGWWINIYHIWPHIHHHVVWSYLFLTNSSPFISDSPTKKITPRRSFDLTPSMLLTSIQLL